MSGIERDDDLEDYLRHRSILPHRLSDADGLEPSPELDRLILSRAREAIRREPPEPVYRTGRWVLPFSLAATLILAFAVVLHMQRPIQVGQKASEPLVAEVQTDASSSVRPPQLMIEESSSAAKSARSESAADERVASAAPPAVAPPAAAARRGFAPPEPARAEQAAPRNERQRLASKSMEASDSAPAETAPAPPRMPAPERWREAEVTESGALYSRKEAEDATPALARERVDVQRIQMTNITHPTAVMLRQPLVVPGSVAYPDPARWLETIRQLRAEGKAAQAERALAAFRKAYPDYPTDTDDTANSPRDAAGTGR